jgi:hypothetical protein
MSELVKLAASAFWNHKTCLMIHAQFDFTGG